MRLMRSCLAAVAALALVPAAAATAQAAPPANDTPAGAVAVSALPFRYTEDTTKATTDALDASLNQFCGAPFTNGSVWFTYTDTSGDGFVADMTASSFSGGFMATEGDPAKGNLVACGPGSIGVRGAPGATYYIVAFSDTPLTGGNLDVTFSPAPPAPQTSLTVDRWAKADRTGGLTLSGTYSCSNADGWSSEIFGSVTQRIGRVKITGYLSVYPLECDGATHQWVGYVVSDTGLFAGGKAASVTIALACGLLDCTAAEVTQTLQVRRGG